MTVANHWGRTGSILPKLLLSATHLVKLVLYFIPHSGYIPPEAMATSLCVDQPRVTSPSFSIPTPTSPFPRKPTFASASAHTLYPPQSHQNSIQRGQRIFGGDLGPDRCPSTQRIAYSLLRSNHIRHTTTLPVISRRPTLRAPEMGYIAFNSTASIVKFPSQTSDYGVLSMQIPCTAPEWQLSSLEQVCTSSFHVGSLYIFGDRRNPPRWQNDVENTTWLELLRPVRRCEEFLPMRGIFTLYCARSARTCWGKNDRSFSRPGEYFLEGVSGLLHEGIKRFVAARRLSSHPVAVSRRYS
jgi:hypothetical protein